MMPLSHCWLKVLLASFWASVLPCCTVMRFSRFSISVVVARAVVFESCIPVILPLPSTKGIPGSVVCALTVPAVAGALPGADEGAMGVRNCVRVATSTFLAEGGMLLVVALADSSSEVGAGLPSVLVRSTSTKGKGVLLWKENRVALLPVSVTSAWGPAVSLQTPPVVQFKLSSEARLGCLPVYSLLANSEIEDRVPEGAQVFFFDVLSSDPSVNTQLFCSAAVKGDQLAIIVPNVVQKVVPFPFAGT